MLKQNRRPSSLSKITHSLSKIQSASHLHPINTPRISFLINKKYYYPALQQQEKHNAQLLTNFLAGDSKEDELQFGQTLKLHKEEQFLMSCYQRAEDRLKSIIEKHFIAQEDNRNLTTHIYIMHFYSFPYQLLQDNRRRKKKYHFKRSFQKKQHLKSTDIYSKKQACLLQNCTDLNNNEVINESQQDLSKLSKCLRNILKKDNTKHYDVFLTNMQKKNLQKEGQKSEGMIKLILNLQKDFSSIYEENNTNEDQFSKESIYGLSDIKKKSKKIFINIDPNKTKDVKEKKILNNFPFCRVDLSKKLKETTSKNNKNHSSTSRNSNKSSSFKLKNPKEDPHNNKSKSRSNKKPTLKLNSDKKSKFIDTQKIYFDTPEINDDKNAIKCSTLKEPATRRPQFQTQKSKKKLGKR